MSKYYPVIISKRQGGRLLRKIVFEEFETPELAKDRATALCEDGDFAASAPRDQAEKLVNESKIKEVVRFR
jgi:hypothetical protein